jgi:hypothetical protein
MFYAAGARRSAVDLEVVAGNMSMMACKPTSLSRIPARASEFAELLYRPLRYRMFSHVAMQNPTRTDLHRYKDLQNPERSLKQKSRKL